MALTSVQNFHDTVKDIARPYAFRAKFNNLRGLDQGDNEITATLRTATFPGVTITPVEIPYFGINYKIAGSPSYEPLTATFLIDAEYKNVAAWYAALDKIFTVDGSSGPCFKAPADYMSTIELFPLGNCFSEGDGGDGSGAGKKWELFHAWIGNIGSISVSQDNKDAPVTFDATINYTYFKFG